MNKYKINSNKSFDVSNFRTSSKASKLSNYSKLRCIKWLLVYNRRIQILMVVYIHIPRMEMFFSVLFYITCLLFRKTILSPSPLPEKYLKSILYLYFRAFSFRKSRWCARARARGGTKIVPDFATIDVSARCLRVPKQSGIAEVEIGGDSRVRWYDLSSATQS